MIILNRQRKRKMQKEARLKREVLEILKISGIFAWNNRNVGVWDKARRKYIPAPILGISDIIGIIPPEGRFLAIEIKIKPNKPTKHQELFLEQVRKNGGIGLVIYDTGELIEWLKEIKKI